MKFENQAIVNTGLSNPSQNTILRDLLVLNVKTGFYIPIVSCTCNDYMYVYLFNGIDYIFVIDYEIYFISCKIKCNM